MNIVQVNDQYLTFPDYPRKISVGEIFTKIVFSLYRLEPENLILLFHLRHFSIQYDYFL